MYHNLKKKKFVAPVDVLMDIDILLMIPELTVGLALYEEAWSGYA